LINFRAGIIRALVSSGYEVIAVAPLDGYSDLLPALGCRYISFPMDNKGTNPVRDLLLIARFFFLFLNERPHIILAYTVKPNIYSSLVARTLGIPIINNIAGLGSVFINDNFLTKIVKFLYRVTMSHSTKIFFQNDDDMRLFLVHKLVRTGVVDRVPGSGVDLLKFQFKPLPNVFPLRFILIARMILEKGVGEFVEAAKIIKTRGFDIDFCLVGFLDVQNSGAVSRKQMDDWLKEGHIYYLGEFKDVRQQIESADCVVLPSFYREGVPRTLLEAAAMGRPIITTNTVGCKDVVDDGVNGFVCNPRDSVQLADTIERMIRLTNDERTIMGIKSREKVTREFDEKIVIEKYLKAISNIIGTSSACLNTSKN